MTKGKIDLKDFDLRLEKHSLEVLQSHRVELRSIINYIKSGTLSDISQSLTNYLIIRFVSIVEIYTRNVVREMIDIGYFDGKGILLKDEITISILDLDEIKINDKITKGRIIVNNINFQNLDKIEEVFSTLLQGHSFFTKIDEKAEEYKIKITAQVENGERKKENVILFDKKEFRELFTLRHNIIHKMDSGGIIDIDKIERFHHHIEFFIVSTELIIISEILKNSKIEMEVKEKEAMLTYSLNLLSYLNTY